MKKIEKYYNLINEHLSEFEKYYNSLISFNEKVNLTAITDKEDVFIKHFLDSILSIEEIKENSHVIILVQVRDFLVYQSKLFVLI